MEPASTPIANQAGRPPLARDSQQWLLDYLIQETGKVFHFQGDGRGGLPRAVRSHAMISKHVGLEARRTEALARTEEDAGHPETALAFYHSATMAYARAQHVIFEMNDEKRLLYAGLRRCYERVIELAPYRIEHVRIPWRGTEVTGLLHLNPHVSTGPLMFNIPGWDTTKEGWPHPHFNAAHQRGMHVFSFEGPGWAESNFQGIRLEADNYEDAASAALDHLSQRPEVDADRIVMYAPGGGSFFGLRVAARDQRIKAVAAPHASVCDCRILMDLESPRWKQMFAFITGSRSEEQLDALVSELTLDGLMERISCPVVIAVGEYNPRCPLSEVYRLFDQMKAPAELWVHADQHHPVSLGPGGASTSWTQPLPGIMADWLRDRLAGKPLAHPGEVLYVDPRGLGPNSPEVPRKRHWYED